MIRNQGKPIPEQSYKWNNWERHWVIKEFLKRLVDTLEASSYGRRYVSLLAVFAVEEDHIERA